MTGLATFLLLLISLACRTTVVAPEELITVDQRFQAETAKRGTSGWVGAFALGGKLVTGGGVIAGRNAIVDAMAVLDSPDYSLTWEPEFAEGQAISATPTAPTRARHPTPTGTRRSSDIVSPAPDLAMLRHFADVCTGSLPLASISPVRRQFHGKTEVKNRVVLQ